MTQLTVIVNQDNDSDSENETTYPPFFTFNIKCNESNTKLTYSSGGVKSYHYADLIQSIQVGNDYRLICCSSNGYAAIHNNCKTSMIEFYISKCGGTGGCNDVKTMISNKLCLNAFKIAHQSLVAYEEENKS